jgi:hypothetical protein
MSIRLASTDYGMYLLVNVETGQDILIQTDWDRPGIASSFGWEPCPFCRLTDGTIDCKHRSASAMIQSATNFLDNHIGEKADDPGYFS